MKNSRELLGLEPVGLMNSWVSWDGLGTLNVSMMPTGSGIVWHWRLDGGNTQEDLVALCQDNIEALGLSRQEVQFKNKWRRRNKWKTG